MTDTASDAVSAEESRLSSAAERSERRDLSSNAEHMTPSRLIVPNDDGTSAVSNLIDLRVDRPRPLLTGLPEFPQSTAIDRDVVRSIRPFVLSFDDFSDFNGVSLFSWGRSVDPGFRVASLDGNLVVEFNDYLSGQRFFSFLGDEHVEGTATTIIEHACQRGLDPVLRLIPEPTATLLDERRWERVEDVDASDYVYSTVDAAAMEGKPYRSLRYSVNAWNSRWSANAQLHWTDLAALRARKAEILDLVEAWQRRGSDGASLNDHELRAIDHLLSCNQEVSPGLTGWSGMCTVDGQLAAFFVNERVDYRRLAGHFLKVTDHPAGDRLYGWFFVQLCRRARDAGVLELNLQQDLGIPGLRTTKRQLRPSRHLHKFTVRPR